MSRLSPHSPTHISVRKYLSPKASRATYIKCLLLGLSTCVFLANLFSLKSYTIGAGSLVLTALVTHDLRSVFLGIREVDFGKETLLLNSRQKSILMPYNQIDRLHFDPRNMVLNIETIDGDIYRIQHFRRITHRIINRLERAVYY